MLNKDTDIQKMAKLLAAHMKFKLDYRTYLNQERKLMIVEGVTDQEFLGKIKSEKVDCVVAAKVFNSNAPFHTTPVKYINCKDAIVILITGISFFPSPFVQYPQDMDKWDIYGLVDKDCEELQFQRPSPRLFVTDTHDLETMLLSTDDDLLARLNGCEVSQDDINSAFFIAYQLAGTRNLLSQYYDRLNLRAISGGAGNIMFDVFIEDNRISINRIIRYINDNTETPISAARLKNICGRVCSSKEGKKLFATTGLWKRDLNAFVANRPTDFWDLVNGHDILQALMFICTSAYNAYNESHGYSLNRSFEMSLITAYDYSKFNATTLQDSMAKAGLLNN